MRELLQSEDLCRTYYLNSCRWLLDLYCPNSRAFHIAASAQKLLPGRVSPNAATSHIGVVSADLLDLISPTAPAEEQQLQTRVLDARSAFTAIAPKKLLPLDSLGPLPLFTTSFLLEFLSLDHSCLKTVSFAIASRRILYLVFVHLIRDSNIDDLPHPYLLFRLARSVVSLKRLFKTGVTELDDFKKLLSDEVTLAAAVPPDVNLGELLGFKKNSGEFKKRLLSQLNQDTLDSLLQIIEKHALTCASTELAWHGTPRKDRADPTALLFSTATLSFLNAHRHDILISQSINVLLPMYAGGTLPARRPFQIDDRGRALFVATLECSSTLLDMALSRFHRITDMDLSELLRVTDDLQSHMIEDVNEFISSTPSGPKRLFGWCSDRAFSRTRIDSWVSVEAYAFFRKRLQLIGLTKKKRILSEYSWLPPSRCSPPWDQIVDPNLGQNASTLILKQVQTIVSNPSDDQARLFLLYGPPGTAKTTIAYGLARKLNWDLITLSPSDFVVDSLDQIEHRSRELFTHMTNIDRCVVLFDEMDTLLRDRDTLGTSSPGMMIEFVVPALLPKLQQFRDHLVGRQIAAFFVTNYYERLDSAVRRGGRLDNHLLILPYTREAQIEVGTRILVRKQGIKKRGRVSTAELEALLGTFPCNLTYRDLDWLCSAILKGRSGRKAIDRRRSELGVSPMVYSHTKRPSAYRELFAFMHRYNELPVGSEIASATNQEILAYFEDCKRKNPIYAGFFSDWIAFLS